MRKLLILAFLLYDYIAIAAASATNYDYDDDASKRHSLIDERRNWRKKALSKPEDNRDWDRRRYDYDAPKYVDDVDPKSFNGIDRHHELDVSAGYPRQHRYEDVDKMASQGMKSAEIPHSAGFPEKEHDKKPTNLNCERPHERFESCFAGCASVTCDNPRDRMQPCYPFCEAGCICVHPYVRDDRTHKCVLPEDCTKGLKGIPDLGEEFNYK